MDNLKHAIEELKHLLVEALSKPKNVAFTAGGLGAALIAYVTLKTILKRRRYAHIPGPPTKGILGFIRGNAIDINEFTSKGRVFPELLLEWRKKYGEVFKFRIYNEICVYTSDRDTIKEVLIEQNFPKSAGQARRVGYPMGERLLGIGLLSDPINERWKHRRAIFNPGFHRHVLMTFMDQFNQITNTLTEKFRTLADGKTVIHLFNEINKATLDAISLIAFGMNTDAVTQKESLLNSYLSRILQLLMLNVFDPFFRFRPNKRAQFLEFQKMIRYLRKIGKEKIMERLNAIQNNEHVPNDILTSILSGSKDDELDLEAMIDDFITFFIAGQETTANTLAFCFLELGKRPELAIKAREEVDRVLGDRTDMNYQDVTDLKYCSAIFKEALRLYPPASLVTRQAINSITIKGVKIPSDTQLFMSTFVTSRDEQYFHDPLEFIPERFLKSANEHSMENYVYYPFSLGPRNCIGQTFAQLEGVVVIAKMVQKFDIKLDPTQSMAINQALTLRPKDGTRCFLTVRS